MGLTAVMATMRDVADEAEVSVATVSACVSGRRFVSPALKARVERAIATLGYQPDGIARSLRTGSTDLIGLVIPDITNPFFTEFVHGVELMAKAYGYATILADSNYDIAAEAKMMSLMRQQRVDGLILCPAGSRSDYRFDGWSRDIPVVIVDNAWDDTPFDTITLDNVVAGLETTRHILQQGHRDIAIIAGPKGNHTSDERLQGFERAMGSAKLRLQPDFIRHADFREAGGYREAQALIDLKRRPSAIFVANNNMLIGVMRALHDRGLKAPDDMSVASIDDFPWAGAFRPGLTTARQPVGEMAQHALRLIRKRAFEEEVSPREQVMLPAQLIVRDSVRRH
ncbi:MAG: LacI family DNA-binding transcriptional regulator [Rhodospirillaceae bacterium]|nr:LacI family DNA-binding transcriptional regulator [Rhodospirillaceae bacterium]